MTPPGDSPADLCDRGIAAMMAGHLAAAEPLLRRAAAASPTDALPHHALGDLLLMAGRPAEAVAPLTVAVQVDPAAADAWVSLGRALMATGQLAAAVNAFGHATALGADDPAIDAATAALLDALGRPAEAVAVHRRLADRLPFDARVLNNFGQALVRGGHPGTGAAVLRRAVDLDPAMTSAAVNLATALRELGQPTEASTVARAAVERRPDDPRAGSVYLYGLHFDPAAAPEQIAAEHAVWADRHATSLPPVPRPPRPPGDRLRVGYVSPDFRDHVVGRFVAPIVAAHDRSAVEVYCYADVTAADAVTAALRSSADRWRDTAALDDAALATLVAADGIDVLVDLTGHMAGGRPLAFARRPAPVQVSHVGYPASTGVPAIGFRVTDRHLDPNGGASLLLLPDSFYLYVAPDHEPGRSPGLTDGAVTFGSVAAVNKSTPAAVELWAAVLRRVPTSRLLLAVPPDGSTAGLLSDAFTQRGVDPARLILEPTRPFADYLRLYDRIDVVLDPQPYGGGITTCDALACGVPVVTLVGPTGVGRVAASVVRTIGCGDWACDTVDDYADRAAGLAAERPARGDVRQRLLASPVCDVVRYTRALENLYRQAVTAGVG